MATPMGRADRIFPRWLVAVVVLGLVGLLLYALRGVLTPVFFALLIAYMLDPLVDRFEARKIPRSVGIAVLLTLVLGALVVFGLLAVPGIVRDASDFVSELPETARGIEQALAPHLAEFGVELPSTMSEAATLLTGESEPGAEGGGIAVSGLAKAAEPALMVVRWLLGGTASLLGAAASLVIIPVFAAYLLHDFDRMTAGIGELIPAKWRPFIVDIAHEVDVVLGEFIRGQLIVMLILAVLYGVTYSLLGVRLAILIGVVAGLLSFIPYVGGAVALGFAVVMCLADWGGWGQFAGVVIAYTLIQVLEGFVITPKVVGDKVGLSAIWVLFALMVGGELFGFLGVLLALPAAAVLKIFVLRGLTWYRASEFFLDGPGPPISGALSALLNAEGLPDDARTAASKAAARSGGVVPATVPGAPDHVANADLIVPTEAAGEGAAKAVAAVVEAVVEARAEAAKAEPEKPEETQDAETPAASDDDASAEAAGRATVGAPVQAPPTLPTKVPMKSPVKAPAMKAAAKAKAPAAEAPATKPPPKTAGKVPNDAAAKPQDPGSAESSDSEPDDEPKV